MTSRQLINQMCYEYSTKNYNEEKLKTTQEIKKNLNLLEEYKKIEEELGIDLITLFKARNDGFYVRLDYINEGEISIVRCKDIKYVDLMSYSIYTNYDNGLYVDFEDYGKTWALTREELEDD